MTMNKQSDSHAEPKENLNRTLAQEPEDDTKAKFVGAKGILEFDLETSAAEFQTACKAEQWRGVVETMEYRLADLEYTPSFKGQRKLISMLLLELRDACYSSGVSTELMEEDRKDQQDDKAH